MWLFPADFPVLAGGATLVAMSLFPSMRRQKQAGPDIRNQNGPGEAEVADPQAIDREWKRLQADYESRHKCALVCIVHDDDEWLDNEEATDILEKVRTSKGKPIHVVLHTLGGFQMASERIADALVASRRATAFVPYYAMSGGTEIALAANEIVMDKHANLGPTDVQLYNVPAGDFEQLEKEKGIGELDDATALLAIRARRLKRDVKAACHRINPNHKRRTGFLGLFGERSCELSEKLNTGHMDHSHRITVKEAMSLGIRVRAGCPKDVFALVDTRRAQLKRMRILMPILVVSGDANPGLHQLKKPGK